MSPDGDEARTHRFQRRDVTSVAHRTKTVATPCTAVCSFWGGGEFACSCTGPPCCTTLFGGGGKLQQTPFFSRSETSVQSAPALRGLCGKVPKFNISTRTVNVNQKLSQEGGMKQDAHPGCTLLITRHDYGRSSVRSGSPVLIQAVSVWFEIMCVPSAGFTGPDRHTAMETHCFRHAHAPLTKVSADSGHLVHDSTGLCSSSSSPSGQGLIFLP